MDAVVVARPPFSRQVLFCNLCNHLEHLTQSQNNNGKWQFMKQVILTATFWGFAFSVCPDIEVLSRYAANSEFILCDHIVIEPVRATTQLQGFFHEEEVEPPLSSVCRY
jgi:hypothetical protein